MARDGLLALPGIGGEQDLGALERAGGMPTAAQQSAQFVALGLTQFDPVAYIHGGLLGFEVAMNRTGSVCQPSSEPSFTDRQGQYLAFIYAYTRIHRRPPAEADMQRHFQVSPPTVHQMVLALERAGLIRRQPGVARSIEVLVAPECLPVLR
jgi:hypothetical protein